MFAVALHCVSQKGSNAETRDRTGDLQIFSLTLSQLSYRGLVTTLSSWRASGRAIAGGTDRQRSELDLGIHRMRAPARHASPFRRVDFDAPLGSVRFVGRPLARGSIELGKASSWLAARSKSQSFNKSDPPRTRTWNLRLRRPTPYPLGQRAV